MRSLTLLVCLLAITSRVFAADANTCLIVANETVGYNLCPYASGSPYTITSNSGTGGDMTLNVINPSNNAWATVTVGQNSYSFINAPVFSLTSNSTTVNETLGVTATYNITGTILVVNFICDSSLSTTSGNVFTPYTFANGVFTTSATSEFGCGFSGMSIIAFMQEYEILFVVLFAILGLFVTFFGFKMFNIVLFIVTSVAGTLVLGTLLMEFVHYGASPGVKWVVFGVCLLFGCVLGYIAVRFEKVGFFALGFALGVIGGLVLYQSILAPLISTPSTGKIVFYVVLSLLGLIGGFLGIWIYKDIIIISTSVVGAYMAVRAVSVPLGGFPAEASVANGTAVFTPVAYAYLAVIILLAIAGLYVQFKHKKESEDTENMNNPDNIYNNMGKNYQP